MRKAAGIMQLDIKFNFRKVKLEKPTRHLNGDWVGSYIYKAYNKRISPSQMSGVWRDKEKPVKETENKNPEKYKETRIVCVLRAREKSFQR